MSDYRRMDGTRVRVSVVVREKRQPEQGDATYGSLPEGSK